MSGLPFVVQRTWFESCFMTVVYENVKKTLSMFLEAKLVIIVCEFMAYSYTHAAISDNTVLNKGLKILISSKDM